jgi:hypothetical protein
MNLRFLSGQLFLTIAVAHARNDAPPSSDRPWARPQLPRYERELRKYQPTKRREHACFRQFNKPERTHATDGFPSIAQASDARGVGNDPPLRTELLHTASGRPRSSRPARNVHRQLTSLAVRFPTATVPCFTTTMSNSTACPSRNLPLHDPEIALAARAY